MTYITNSKLEEADGVPDNLINAFFLNLEEKIKEINKYHEQQTKETEVDTAEMTRIYAFKR